ncbi:hypothetical protein FOZ62_024880, partial [Perkinsus olseni]
MMMHQPAGAAGVATSYYSTRGSSGATTKYNGKSQLLSRDPRKRFESNAWRRRLHQWRSLGNDKRKRYVTRQRIRTMLLTLFYILLIICSQFLVIYFSPQNAQPLTSIVSAFVGVVSIWRATSWLDWIIFVDVLLDVFANRLQAELRGDKDSKEGRNDDDGIGYYDEEEDGSLTEGRSIRSYDDDVEERPYHHQAHSYNGKRRSYYQHSYDGDDEDVDGNYRGRRYDPRVRPRYPSLTKRRLQQLNKRSDDSTPYATRVDEDLSRLYKEASHKLIEQQHAGYQVTRDDVELQEEQIIGLEAEVSELSQTAGTLSSRVKELDNTKHILQEAHDLAEGVISIHHTINTCNEAILNDNVEDAAKDIAKIREIKQKYPKIGEVCDNATIKESKRLEDEVCSSVRKAFDSAIIGADKDG